MRSQFLLRFQTVLSLGIPSVLQVVLYRILKRLGYYEWRTPVGAPPEIGRLFGQPDSPPPGSGYETALAPADQLMSGEIAIFGGQNYQTGNPPAWQKNSATGRSSEFSDRHWSRIADFDAEFGDIKLVWELSRFQWILLFARAYLQSGDTKYVDSANTWAGDWIKQNPANCGLNWMCAQETSIRLVHTLLAESLLSGADAKDVYLQDFVYAHCDRIGATTQYAAAQKNNHIISEAAGLIIGGSWLAKYSSSISGAKKGKKWCLQGRRLLERSVAQLIMEDGSFAQYSTVYHRLLLDTLSIVEWWRQRMGLPKLSNLFYERGKSATNWLFNFVDELSGDAPNLGANDGALVYAFCGDCHRDFRPTVQLAGYTFCDKDFYGAGSWNEPLQTLGMLEKFPRADIPNSTHYPIGGFSVIRSHTDGSRMYCRFPNFRFRPSQSDALHVDLWRNGINVLRDGGSYSYAATDEETDYFMGVRSHNTCQFDFHDQMPRLGRFLYGSWLPTNNVQLAIDDENQLWQASYTDCWGCSHERTVETATRAWIITDKVSGPFKQVVLRWRLCPEFAWQLLDEGVDSETASINILSDTGPISLRLMDEIESRRYFETRPISVLEVTYPQGSRTIVTTISFDGH